MLWFASFQRELYSALLDSADQTLAGVAQKAVKEVDYHRDHATQWVLRLGDGTDVSHERMQAGLDAVHPYVAELGEDFAAATWATEQGIGVLPSSLALHPMLLAAGLGPLEPAPAAPPVRPAPLLSGNRVVATG